MLVDGNGVSFFSNESRHNTFLMAGIDPLNGSWMALNAGSAGERSITMAILIMSANTSGIIGSQLFQEHDAPLYKTGWTAIMALASVGLVMAIIANLQYYFLNGRRISRRGLKYSP
jgi:hypothetical protein